MSCNNRFISALSLADRCRFQILECVENSRIETAISKKLINLYCMVVIIVARTESRQDRWMHWKVTLPSGCSDSTLFRCIILFSYGFDQYFERFHFSFGQKTKLCTKEHEMFETRV